MEPSSYTRAKIVNFQIAEQRRTAREWRRASHVQQNAPAQSHRRLIVARASYWFQRLIIRLAPAPQ